MTATRIAIACGVALLLGGLLRSASAAPECKGFGADGRPEECVQQAVAACTPTFEPDDRLAQECRAQGGTACRCACHDFVCSIRLDGYKTPIAQEQTAIELFRAQAAREIEKVPGEDRRRTLRAKLASSGVWRAVRSPSADASARLAGTVFETDGARILSGSLDELRGSLDAWKVAGDRRTGGFVGYLDSGTGWLLFLGETPAGG